jgi:hypothetical protein
MHSTPSCLYLHTITINPPRRQWFADPAKDHGVSRHVLHINLLAVTHLESSGGNMSGIGVKFLLCILVVVALA